LIEFLQAEFEKKLFFSLQIFLKRLWGTEKPPAFKEMMVLLSLLKDIEGSSFADLQNKIEDCLSISKGSIEHLSDSTRIVTLGENNCCSNFSKNTEVADRPPPTTKVSLWVDSTDFRKTRKRRMKDDRKSWSHKLSSTGRIWMTITNAHEIAQWISLPQLPTNYDGNIFLSSKGELEETFPNTWIIGDNHFKKVEKYFTKIRVIAPTSPAGRPKMIKGIRTKTVLTDQEEKDNQVIAGV
jgi:hypothetical protein